MNAQHNLQQRHRRRLLAKRRALPTDLVLLAETSRVRRVPRKDSREVRAVVVVR